MHSTIRLPSGHKVHLVDTGCDIAPRMHFVWLGQISPDFAAVYGDDEGEAHEYFADAIGFSALSNECVAQLAKECQDDKALGNNEAWAEATEGMLALNGGAEWIDNGDWGFWNPTKDEMAALKIACETLRNAEG